ncbi:MAG: hypothetical protein GXO29_07935 [Thermotogae bacterium]|nr:hypothetical protein [Thermotogota bacterium]
MKEGWLKVADRLIRIDRIHEFWIENVDSGYVIKAAVFGLQDVVLAYLNSYDEAEQLLERIFRALRKDKPMIDVVALKEGEWDEDDYTDDYDFGDFFDPDDFPDDDYDLPF